MIIVDDDPGVRTYLARYLRRLPGGDDLRIDVHDSPEAALRALPARDGDASPPVVVTGFRFRDSDMDGLKLLSEVARRLPVARRFLMSGFQAEEFEGKLESIDGFLAKPLDRDAYARLCAEIGIPYEPGRADR